MSLETIWHPQLPSWKSELSMHAQTATSQCLLLFTDQVSHRKSQVLPFFQLTDML